MNKQIRVGIVEDHPVFRQGLAGLVEDTAGLDLALAVRSLPELDAKLALHAGYPDVLLLDLSLSGGGPQGVDAVATVCQRRLRVLVVSANASPAVVIGAIGAGAAGYVSKDAEPEEIVLAIRTVAADTPYISPALAGYLLDDAHVIELTPREKDVLRLVASGEKDIDIADELFISVHTVHSHLDRIRAKTGSHRRAELTALAIERGIRRDGNQEG